MSQRDAQYEATHSQRLRRRAGRGHPAAGARRDGSSLNQAALKLLRRGAGLPDGQGAGRNIGSALDDLFGSWSQEEAEAFDASLEVFETVDESAWR